MPAAGRFDAQALTSFFALSTALERLLPAPPAAAAAVVVVMVVVVDDATSGTSDLSEWTRFRCEKQFPELATARLTKNRLIRI